MHLNGDSLEKPLGLAALLVLVAFLEIVPGLLLALARFGVVTKTIGASAVGTLFVPTIKGHRGPEFIAARQCGTAHGVNVSSLRLTVFRLCSPGIIPTVYKSTIFRSILLFIPFSFLSPSLPRCGPLVHNARH